MATAELLPKWPANCHAQKICALAYQTSSILCELLQRQKFCREDKIHDKVLLFTGLNLLLRHVAAICCLVCSGLNTQPYYIHFSNKARAPPSTPAVRSLTKYICRNFSRSYIHAKSFSKKLLIMSIQLKTNSLTKSIVT